jgi:hypothetical protein
MIFLLRSPAFLIGCVVLVASIILLCRSGGLPALLQVIGSAAYLAMYACEFAAMFGLGSSAAESGVDAAVTFAHGSPLTLASRIFAGLVLCFPIGFLWHVLRVTRRT